MSPPTSYDGSAFRLSRRHLLATATPLSSLPLVVVSKGQPFGIPAEALGFDPAALETAWAAAQEGLAGLLPDAPLVVAERSAHYVQLEQPELVIGAIRRVVAAVRDPSTWASEAARSTARIP